MASHTDQYTSVPLASPAVAPSPPPPISIPSLILIAVTFVVFFPTFLLMRLVGITSPSDSISEFVVSNFNNANPVESQYRLQFSQEHSAQLRLKAALAAAASFLAALVIPSLRSSLFLNWTFLAVVVFCARYLVDHVLKNTAAALLTMFDPLGSALHSALIFLTWWVFGLDSVDNPVTRYGVWVLGAWMIRCFVILFNSAVLARWRANALFHRYEERILRVGFQFHIMYALVPSAAKDMSFLAPWRKKDGDVEIMQIGSDGNVVEICWNVEDHIRYSSRQKTTKQEVCLVAMHIQGLSSLLPPELGDTLADAIKLEQQITLDTETPIDKKWIKEKMKLNNEDARILYGELLTLVTSPDQVSYDTFATWIRGAYKDSLNLGQTLRDGDNMILNSDRLLIALLINKAFLLWLFLTSNTTTQVLSVIPFVYFAKSFIQEVSGPQFKMLIG